MGSPFTPGHPQGGDIGIGRNSIDVQLRNLTVDGASAFGIFVFESSQVSLARVTARDPGFATVGVFDVSDVHIESCLFENSTGALGTRHDAKHHHSQHAGRHRHRE